MYASENFSRYWAIMLLLLVSVSFRLWLPVDWTDSSAYPNVPLFGFPESITWWISACLLPVIVAATGVIVLSGRESWQRLSWLVIAVMLAVGFAGDQHRLQPWAYQSCLYAVWFVLLPARWQMTACRVLTISIYFYSSLGKFDYQFLHTVGQDFLGTAMRPLGVEIEQWSMNSRLNAAVVFPAAEFLVACLLMFSRTRLVGGCLAIGMHTTLIAMLSPLGMNHSAGVMMWNAVLAGQSYWLFLHAAEPSDAVNREAPIAFRSVRIAISLIVLLLAILLPLSERRDRADADAWHWDHWLSWSLYSPHNSRLNVEIHASVIDSIPVKMKSSIAEDEDGDGWHEFDLGSFSLQSRGVPVFPQARYQQALASAIAQQNGWTHGIRGVLRSSSDRWDGTRREVWMNRLD
jgi:hypothetical protein